MEEPLWSHVTGSPLDPLTSPASRLVACHDTQCASFLYPECLSTGQHGNMQRLQMYLYLFGSLSISQIDTPFFFDTEMMCTGPLHRFDTARVVHGVQCHSKMPPLLLTPAPPTPAGHFGSPSVTVQPTSAAKPCTELMTCECDTH